METQNNTFNKELHTKYFIRCLGILPPSAVIYDSSRLSLVYFCLSALDILGTLETATTETQRTQWADWIYSNIVNSKEGFRASPTHAIPSELYTNASNKDTTTAIETYDCASLSATYFALTSLAILKDKRITKLVDSEKVANYIGKCQRKQGCESKPYAKRENIKLEMGSFSPTYSSITQQPFGEFDPRCNYMALSTLFILNKLPAISTGSLKDLKVSSSSKQENEIDLKSVISFILSSKSYEGGLGMFAGTESHTGYTYCGLSSIKILLSHNIHISDKNEIKEFLQKTFNVFDWTQTIRWLSRRQIGPILETYRTDLKRYNYRQSDNSAYSDEPEPAHIKSFHKWEEEEIGAFNGRTNKQGDTCYSFWSTASLMVLYSLIFGSDHEKSLPINVESAENFLLNHAQSKLTGGFGREKGYHPDHYHSYLAVTSLSILDSKTKHNYGLKDVVPEFCLTKETVEWIKTLEWD